ncbi:hypothetical protein TMatcc_005118 [Talaromyces marneffei ATCC 18224]|uniref:Uncharacterized protein n=1 Tax=Talaromyces marneffei (strain ATCC 18224 / CBS 334.59 / QM 7333) TaxID=441960 RepID=B6QCF2_TALMQ|nr:conserved hypothetical protein [Talaromyces marneffei ATCC 18224]
MSFEIYSPQPDVFACVEHQRREIAHRKTTTPGEGFFPGIAKVVPNRSTWLLQGLLFLITSNSYREGFRAPDYEDETGPLWVSFNRSFPVKAKVDVRSRLLWVPPTGYNPSAVEESDISPEREEIMVKTCRHTYYPLKELHFVLMQSYISDDDDGFDYGLDDDEGDPDLLNQLPASEIIELWQLKANSYPYDDFPMQLAAEGPILIKPKMANGEPDLQYVIYVSFAHISSQLPSIALAFTAAIIENLPRGKTVNFEFHSASSQSLSAILASHRNVMNARPGTAVGAYKHESQTRIFPQHRQEDCPETALREREPYHTFFVVVDRPDFLIAPGVLFFLTDGNEVTDEWRQNVPQQMFEHERNDYWPYQVWRSAGMPEVARRLAMLRKEQ